MAAVKSANRANIEYSLKASEKLEAFPDPGGAIDFMMADILGLTQEANQNVTAVI
jgi:hypothetical protein